MHALPARAYIHTYVWPRSWLDTRPVFVWSKRIAQRLNKQQICEQQQQEQEHRIERNTETKWKRMSRCQTRIHINRFHINSWLPNYYCCSLRLVYWAASDFSNCLLVLLHLCNARWNLYSWKRKNTKKNIRTYTSMYILVSPVSIRCEIDKSVVVKLFNIILPQWCEHHLHLPRFKHIIHIHKKNSSLHWFLSTYVCLCLYTYERNGWFCV